MSSSVLASIDSSGTVPVRRASAGDVGALSSTLSAAFFDDPVFVYVLSRAAQ